jgi:hypothetical protein
MRRVSFDGKACATSAGSLSSEQNGALLSFGIRIFDIYLRSLLAAMSKQINIFPIDLRTPAITGAYATMFGEAAAVCFEENSHASGVLLSVGGLSVEAFTLNYAHNKPPERWSRSVGDDRV